MSLGILALPCCAKVEMNKYYNFRHYVETGRLKEISADDVDITAYYRSDFYNGRLYLRGERIMDELGARYMFYNMWDSMVYQFEFFVMYDEDEIFAVYPRENFMEPISKFYISMYGKGILRVNKVLNIQFIVNGGDRVCPQTFDEFFDDDGSENGLGCRVIEHHGNMARNFFTLASAGFRTIEQSANTLDWGERNRNHALENVAQFSTLCSLDHNKVREQFYDDEERNCVVHEYWGEPIGDTVVFHTTYVPFSAVSTLCSPFGLNDDMFVEQVTKPVMKESVKTIVDEIVQETLI